MTVDSLLNLECRFHKTPVVVEFSISWGQTLCRTPCIGKSTGGVGEPQEVKVSSLFVCLPPQRPQTFCELDSWCSEVSRGDDEAWGDPRPFLMLPCFTSFHAAGLSKLTIVSINAWPGNAYVLPLQREGQLHNKTVLTSLLHWWCFWQLKNESLPCCLKRASAKQTKKRKPKGGGTQNKTQYPQMFRCSWRKNTE